MDGGWRWPDWILAAVLPGVLCIVAAPVVSAQGADAAQTQRLTNVDLEYSASTEALAKELGAYVDQIKPSFSQYMKDNTLAFQQTLLARRGDDLAFVCRLLHLPAATPGMQEVYDFYVREWFPKLVPVLDFKKVEVWDEQDLRARVRGGEALPRNVYYEPAAGTFYVNRAMQVEGQVSVQGRRKQGESLRFLAADGSAAELCITRIVKSQDLQAPRKLLAREKKAVQREIGILTDPAGAHNPFVADMVAIAIHETVEFSLVKYIISSADRRWLADGLANFAAYKRLAELQGADVARQVYAGHYNPMQLGPLAGKVDLFAWPAVENEDEAAPAGNLRLAHYYVATEVVREMARRHGDDIFSRIFQRLPPPVAGGPVARMSDVYAAYQELAGEDLRQVVATVQKRLRPAGAANGG